MKLVTILSTAIIAGTALSAQAFVVNCQWSYNLATSGGSFASLPLAGLNLDPSSNPTVRLRLGFQVTGPGADGGFVGWNVGTLIAAGDCCQSLTRTNGRRTPFNFLPNGNGQPTADPVPCGQPITGIDAVLGLQTLPWVCDPAGNPLTMPTPVIRGLSPQPFVDVYEVTLRLQVGTGVANVTASGNAIASTHWGIVGSATPPDCGDPSDPADDVPGSVTYAPATAAPVAFTCVALVNCVPGPGSAALLGMGMLVCARRRRVEHARR